MMESVSTSSVQGASLRVMPQAANTYAVSGGAAAAVQSDVPKFGTRLAVRLDSAAQRAILEVRSSETGEVVNQYPSEAQMRAFKQAASLDASQEKAARQHAAAEAAVAARAQLPAPQTAPDPAVQSVARPEPQANVQIAAQSVSVAVSSATSAPAVVQTADTGGGAVGGGESVMV